MPASNVPAATFTSIGLAIPTESAILAGRLSDMKTIFGPRLNTTKLSTPQGQLASSETAIIGDINSTFLALARSMDPAYSDGRFQDALGRIYDLDRFPARATTTLVTCRGLAGLIIPVGAFLGAADGNNYVATSQGVIPPAGSVDIAFACLINGPIACPPQTFKIARSVNGWDSAVSVASGIKGVDVEGRVEFEARRQASVAKNSRGTPAAIRGEVLAVDEVLDAYVVDNPTGATVVLGGVTLPPHSVYVAVIGGVASDIAYVIFRKKDLGCAMVGNTLIVVEDTDGYAAPYPSYNIRFQVPVPTTIYVDVQLARGQGIPESSTSQVQAAIISAFAGEDGGPRMRIGGTVYSSRFYAAVAGLGSWAQVLDIRVGTSPNPTGTSATVRLDQVPSTDAAFITLSIV